MPHEAAARAPLAVAGTVPDPASAQLLRLLRIAAAVLALAMVTGFGLFAAITWQVGQDRLAADLNRRSLVTADSLGRLFEAVDQLLISTRDAVAAPQSADAIDPDLARRLHTAIAGMPMVESAEVVDAVGRIVVQAGGLRAPGVAMADPALFWRLRDEPESGLVIGTSEADPDSGVRVTWVGRRIGLPGGRFGGAVVAAVRSSAIEALFATIRVPQKDATVVLARNDGLVLVRDPEIRLPVPNPPPALTARLADGLDGPDVVRITSPIDGLTRAVARRDLVGGRMRLLVTVSAGEVRRAWEWGLLLAGGTAMLMMLVLGTAFGILGRQIRRGAGVAAALRASEARLRLRNAQLAAIYDGTPVGLCVYDRALRYVAANAHLAAVHGRPIERILGLRLRDVRPAFADRVGAALQRVLETGQPIDNLELTDSGSDPDDPAGRRFWLVSYRAMRDEDGDIAGVAGSVLEITALRRAEVAEKALEANLRHSERLTALGELTGGIAHDVNNLLTIMLGNLEMLEGCLADDAEALELVQDCRLAAQRGGELTRSLLAFARRQPLAPQPLDLNLLVEGMARMLTRAFAGITPRLALSPGLPPVMVDRGQLVAALTNLVTNARDAMPDGGALTISTAPGPADPAALPAELPAGDYVVLAVADEGTGMTAAVKAKLFEPFFSTKGPGAGTGLGLSIVYGFAKQSGGHVEVESRLGAGSCFRLWLPCATAAPAQPVPTLSEPGRDAGRSVLVVEDDVALRRIVVRQVAALGYAVQQAGSGEEALGLLESGLPVDLVFSDVVMPGRLDGYDLAEAVARRWPSVRVLLTTGFPGTLKTHRAPAVQRTPLLAKPYRRDALARALRDALAAEPARDPSGMVTSP